MFSAGLWSSRPTRDGEKQGVTIMTLDMNWIAAGAACAAMFLVWLRFRAKVRTLKFVLPGFVVVIGAVLVVEYPARVASLAGVIVAVLVVFSLLSCSFVIVRKRRHIPHYQAPDSMTGRCSECGYTSKLTRTARGWLCGDCQKEAALAGHKR